jgi:hypothetical protein
LLLRSSHLLPQTHGIGDKLLRYLWTYARESQNSTQEFASRMRCELSSEMVVVGINALYDGFVKGSVHFTSLYGSPYYHLPPINLCLLSFTNLVELRITLKTPATGRSPHKNGPGSMLDRAKELAESPAARSMKHLDRIVVMMIMDGIVLRVTCIAGAWIQKSPRLLTSATATNTHTPPAPARCRRGRGRGRRWRWRGGASKERWRLERVRVLKDKT